MGSVFQRKTLAAASFLLWTALPLAGKMHSLNGCVKDAAGAPVQGVIVYLEEVAGTSKYMLATDAKGCFRQDEIPDGHFEVRADVNGLTMARKQVALDKSTTVT